MSTAEWPPIDAQTVPLPTIVSSSDLFDGELFGDELIDIYSSTVSDSDVDGSVDRKSDEPSEEVLAALDDGFADFQSSSTFNDLTNFFSNPLSSEAAPAMLPFLVTTETTMTSPTVPVQVTVTVPNSPSAPLQTFNQASALPIALGNGRKRVSESKLASSLPKKKTTATRRPAPKKVHQATRQMIDASPATVSTTANVVSSFANAIETTVASQPNNGTPNPLPIETKSSEVAKPKVVISKKGGVQHNVKVITQDTRPAAVTSAHGLRAPAGNATVTIPLAQVTPQTAEADFRDQAHAAVSELMTNVATTSDQSFEISCLMKVDTSTAHIKALTGNNWVSGSNGVSPGIDTSASGVATLLDNSDAKSIGSNSGSNRCKRQSLTADERARQNRDRNREHARNTRLRKKAYVEELKQTLTEMVQQRDAAELEKRQSAQRELEQREVRFRVIEEFLKLRGRNETNFARWAAILEDEFVFTVPAIDVKCLQGGQTIFHEHTFNGAKGAMEVSSNFATYLHSFVSEKCMFQHSCDRKYFFMDGCNAFLEWVGNCVDSAGNQEASGIKLKGVVRAKYSPASNKLIAVSMTFDTSTVLDHYRKRNSSGFHSICDSSYEAVAAEVAASQANAILDSLQMPCMTVNVVPNSSSSSEVSSHKGELSSDESL